MLPIPSRMVSSFTAMNKPEFGKTRNKFRISMVHPTDLRLKVRCPCQYTAVSGPPKARCTGEVSVAFAIDCIATSLAPTASGCIVKSYTTALAAPSMMSIVCIIVCSS
jgi:hypothetical protein